MTAVLVTGICGRLGRRLTRVLHVRGPVVGVDRREFPDRPCDLVHHRVDPRRAKLKDVFRHTSISAVVHLGVMHDPRASAAEHHSWNVGGFSRLLEYVTQYKIPKLVVLSSANVYGPQPDNAQFLPESAPLLGGARFSEIRDLIEVDMLAQSFMWRESTTETVVLRPVHILGSVRNAASNFLRLPRVPLLFGFDPMVQVLHEDDLVAAIVLALRPGFRGAFNVAGPPALPLSHLVRFTGRPTMSIPYSLSKSVLRSLWSMHIASFPPPELDHIRFVCMVDDARARSELGFRPRYDIEETAAAVSLGTWPS